MPTWNLASKSALADRGSEKFTLAKINRLVGVPWFNEADYPASRLIMADADLLPTRYSEWLEYVQEEVAEILSQGHTPFKVTIEPATFTAWCRERMLVRDQGARKRYAAIVAFRQMDFT